MPEQSAWHTAREPITISSSPLPIAWLPLIDPLLPPTCMFCGWASGSTPVDPGDSTTAAPTRSASARMGAANSRPPPPTFITMRECAAIRSAASRSRAASATAALDTRSRSGNPARLRSWMILGCVFSGSSR